MTPQRPELVEAMAQVWLGVVSPRHLHCTRDNLPEGIRLSREDLTGLDKSLLAWHEPDRASFLNFVNHIGADVLAYCQYLAESSAYFARLGLNGDVVASNPVLGAGRSATVYAVPIGGEQVALKAGGVSRAEVFAYYLGRNILRVSHLLGVDINRHSAVFEFLPGRQYRELSMNERREIPDVHIEQAVQTVIELARAGLSLDGVGDNVLYGPEGFSICDYYCSFHKDRDPRVHVASQLGKLTHVLTYEHGPVRYETRTEKAGVVARVLSAISRVDPDVLANIRAYRAETGRPEDFMVLGFHTNLLPRGEYFDRFRDHVASLGIDIPFGE